MSDKICLLHEESFQNVKDDIRELKSSKSELWKAIDELKDSINKAVWKILIGVTLLFGSAAVALIIFIVTQLPRIKP